MKNLKEQSAGADDESNMDSCRDTVTEILPKDFDEFCTQINATYLSILSPPFLSREGKPPFDTRVSVCPKCAKRGVLANTMAVHEHEIHSCLIAEETGWMARFGQDND